VRRISVADLKSFYQKLAAPNNCVLAIYGDVKTGEVRVAVEKAFANWKSQPLAPSLSPLGGERVVGAERDRERGDYPRRVTESRDKKQAVLVIGFPGTTMHDDDRYPLELIQESCSDLGSRLFLRIREQLGLAYYVGAQNFVGLVPGYIAFYAGTEPVKDAQVERELLKETELLRTEGLTAEELKRSKAKIIGQKKIARQELGHLASTTALDELYGLGYQRAEFDDAKYEAVTLEQIKAAAQKYLKPAGLVVSIVRPEGS
jgi:zinc protease